MGEPSGGVYRPDVAECAGSPRFELSADEAGAVPVYPATSFIVVADRPELEVLLLHRRKQSVFVGGMVVFPGGAVDASDRTAAAAALVDREPAVAGLRDADARAHLVAGARETLEEVGLWVGSGGAAPIVSSRDEIDGGALLLSDVADVGSIIESSFPYAGRWVTPLGAPRRYDTHFFVAEIDDAEPVPDGTEVVACEWDRPSRVVERFARGQLAAIGPTEVYIRALAEFDRAADVRAAARTGAVVDHGLGWTTF